jgi:hypothetical protein
MNPHDPIPKAAAALANKRPRGAGNAKLTHWDEPDS